MDDTEWALDKEARRISPSPDALEATLARARRRQARRRQGGVIAGIALIAVVGLVLWSLFGQIDSSSQQPGAAQGPIKIGGTPLEMSVAGGRVWVLTCNTSCSNDGRSSQGRLTQVDAQSGSILTTTDLDKPQALGVGEAGVWVASFWGSSISKIDPDSGDVLSTTSLTLSAEVAPGDSAFSPTDVVVAGDAVWVVSGRGAIAKIDPSTGEVRDVLDLRSGSLGNAAIENTTVWVGDGVDGILPIDAESGRAGSPVPIGDEARRLAVSQVLAGGGYLWAAGLWADAVIDVTGHPDYELTDQGVLARVDPAGAEQPVTAPLESGSILLAYDQGRLWVQSPSGEEVYSVDPSSLQIAQTIDLGSGRRVAAVGGSGLWEMDNSGSLIQVST